METNNPTIGPVTGNLMSALRHLECSRNAFYDAMESSVGEQLANQELAKVNDLFDAVRNIIEKEITTNVRDWATATPQPATV